MSIIEMTPRRARNSPANEYLAASGRRGGGGKVCPPFDGVGHVCAVGRVTRELAHGEKGRDGLNTGISHILTNEDESRHGRHRNGNTQIDYF